MLVSRRISPALAGVLVSVFLCASAAPAAGASVTVRIEGASGTLLPPTTVTLGAPEPVSNCPANSVAAAINLAVHGNWDHGEANKGGGDFTQTILGETHAFTNNSDTWAEWVDYKWGGGVCSDLLSDGDQVLMVADHEPEPFFSPTVLPLVVEAAPSVLQAGIPFTVTVSEIHTPPGAFAERGQGTPRPAQGVTVSGGGISAVSGANGVATLVLPVAGSIVLQATKVGDAPSAPFAICVHNGNDGTCGTQAPSTSPSVKPPPSGGAVNAGPPPVELARIAGVKAGHIYSRRAAPRLLSGSVEVPAGDSLSKVQISLARRRHGRCYGFDGSRVRFVPIKCDRAASWFSVGAKASFSYLLPARLPAGRYVYEIEAVDGAGHVTKLVPGVSHVVFRVK